MLKVPWNMAIDGERATAAVDAFQWLKKECSSDDALDCLMNRRYIRPKVRQSAGERSGSRTGLDRRASGGHRSSGRPVASGSSHGARRFQSTGHRHPTLGYIIIQHVVALISCFTHCHALFSLIHIRHPPLVWIRALVTGTKKNDLNVTIDTSRYAPQLGLWVRYLSHVTHQIVNR